MVTTLTRTIGAIVAVLFFVAQPATIPHAHASDLLPAERLTFTIASAPAGNLTGNLTGSSTGSSTGESDIDPSHVVSAEESVASEEHALDSISYDTGCNHSCGSSCGKRCGRNDEFWVVSSRYLTWNTCQANLNAPQLRVSRLSQNGRLRASSMGEYLDSIDPSRRVVFYVHGNRTPPDSAVRSGLNFFNRVRANLDSCPTTWVIFSWPSAQAGMLLRDAREKAARTDAQGLYLAWLLQQHIPNSAPIAMVGYSFGARVVSGSLHALAGGTLGRRALPQPHYYDAGISVGFVAPAFESDWMTPNNYHSCTTRNMRTLTLLYNRRDVALRNHWRLTRERSSEALGFSGPRCFGPRADGTPLPVRALNCTASVRARHSERFYYDRACSAGLQMAMLINQSAAGSRHTFSIESDAVTSQY